MSVKKQDCIRFDAEQDRQLSELQAAFKTTRSKVVRDAVSAYYLSKKDGIGAIATNLEIVRLFVSGKAISEISEIMKVSESRIDEAIRSHLNVY